MIGGCSAGGATDEQLEHNETACRQEFRPSAHRSSAKLMFLACPNTHFFEVTPEKSSLPRHRHSRDIVTPETSCPQPGGALLECFGASAHHKKGTPKSLKRVLNHFFSIKCKNSGWVQLLLKSCIITKPHLDAKFHASSLACVCLFFCRGGRMMVTRQPPPCENTVRLLCSK